MNRMHVAAWLILPFAALALGYGILTIPASSVSAQRDRPIPTPNPIVVETAARYGTRYVLPALDAPVDDERATESELLVTNAGWEPARIVVVELGPPAQELGCDQPRSVVLRAVCLGPIGAMQSLTHEPGPDAASLRVYSLDAETADASCGSVAELVAGTITAEDWERTVWIAGHGARIAVAAESRHGQNRAAMEGLPATGVLAIGRAVPGIVQASVLPFVPSGARARWVNGELECLPLNSRIGSVDPGGECEPPRTGRVSLASLASYDPVSPGTNRLSMGNEALAAQGRGELLAATDYVDERGWASYAAAGLRLPQAQQAGKVAFPLVISPLSGSEATLWVTNQHPTRTAQITLLSFDGNGAQRVPYTDEIGLCPGTTRAYDIRAIAGEIPPTNPRRGGDTPGAPLPPMLSVRVEGVSADGTEYVPISAAMEVSSDQGVGAYGGLSLPLLAALSTNDRAAEREGVRAVTIVPDVRIVYGPERISTFLAVMNVSTNLAQERQALVELYDQRGRLMGQPRRVQIGTGPAGYLDFAAFARSLGDGYPDGFRGSAIVRGALGRGVMGAVAMNRPAGTDAGPRGGGDQITVHSGLVLARGPDPSIPTPTPRPTVAPPTATPDVVLLSLPYLLSGNGE